MIDCKDVERRQEVGCGKIIWKGSSFMNIIAIIMWNEMQ